MNHVRVSIAIALFEIALVSCAPTGKQVTKQTTPVNANVRKALRLYKGGGVTARDPKYGGTALMYAAGGGGLKLVQKLIREGSKVNARSNIGTTALQMAAIGGHPAVTEFLLSVGAKVNQRDDDRYTALMLAADGGYPGHVAVGRVLIKGGAGLNLTQKDGWAAIHFASRRNSIPFLRLLLQHRAKVNLRSKKGKTPIEVAVKYDAVNLLRKHGGRGKVE